MTRSQPSNDEELTSAQAGLPLIGVRVLDLSRLLPGPWATMFLSDYGATVTKIEEPKRGDYSRWSQPRYVTESVYFSSVNRNKRSMIIDFTTERGLEVFYRMVSEADVVVESFRPGVADRLGVGYETLSSINPGLIYCSITGFGQSGPYKGHAGHDLNIAGLSGFLNHSEADVPKVAGLQMGDFAAATMAVIAVLLALRTRDSTGKGQYLDVSMFDSLVSWLTIAGATPFAKLAGHSGEPSLQAFGGNPRYAIYRTGDGRFVSVSLLEKSFWEKFCSAVGHEELFNKDETEEARLSNHGELGVVYARVLEKLFLEKTREEWVEFLLPKGIPCFPINSPDEVFSDPQVVAREMVRWIDDSDNGRIPQLGFPVKGSDLKPRMTSSAPHLGEHSVEILRELGYPDEIVKQIIEELGV